MATQNKRQDEYYAHLEEMAAAYALGALDDPAERAYFEDLIAARDKAAVPLLGEMFGVANLLARTVPQMDAPPSVQESLLKKMHHTPRSPETEVAAPTEHKATAIGDKPAAIPEVRAYVPMKVKPYIYGGGALFMMLIIAFSVRLLNQKGPDEETVAHLVAVTRERDSLISMVLSQKRSDSLKGSIFKMLHERDARMVTLTRSGKKDTRVHLFFSPEQERIILMGTGVPTAPAGKRLHLWQIAEGKTMPVGTIDARVAREMYDLPAPHDHADGFALTLEDSTGTTQPKAQALYSGVVPRVGRQ